MTTPRTAPRPEPAQPPSAAPRGAVPSSSRGSEQGGTEAGLATTAPVVAAGVTAVLAAVFGDWGGWSAPLGSGLPGFPLAWGVTAGPPLLLVALAGVYVAWTGTPSFARTWAHTAAGLAAATGLLALLRAPYGVDGVWAALAEASHAGLFGVVAGWLPALAAFAVGRRRARARTGVAPYVWLTGLFAVGPLVWFAVSATVAGDGVPAVCTAAQCVTARANVLFTGEIALRLVLPAWAASVATLAAARRAPRVRALRTPWQLLIGAGAAGLTVLFAPGLVFGATV
ncbi:hypothetical protein [Streptomyces sp. NPDC052225]|uniref:hypothetical protein n=1 Tax=Streptomyces sp. NPDC052225 TaxID=3154949 RepID=UPI003412C79F